MSLQVFWEGTNGRRVATFRYGFLTFLGVVNNFSLSSDKNVTEKLTGLFRLFRILNLRNIFGAKLDSFLKHSERTYSWTQKNKREKEKTPCLWIEKLTVLMKRN